MTGWYITLLSGKPCRSTTTGPSAGPASITSNTRSPRRNRSIGRRYPAVDTSLRWTVMSEHSRWRGLSTKAIHAGFRPDPQTGAVNAPIYASSTFAQDGVGGLRGGFEYARTGNPTRAALEASLAAVEEATFGRAFSSGMAATDCALRAILRPGDHVVIPDDAYGGTFRLIDKVFTQWGIEYTAVALSDL